jgi:hypothetical protein
MFMGDINIMTFKSYIQLINESPDAVRTPDNVLLRWDTYPNFSFLIYPETSTIFYTYSDVDQKEQK